MGLILTYDPDHVPLYMSAKPFVRRASVLLDVGAGVRPQRFVECDRHVCLDAHAEYCDVLRENGFEAIDGEAPAALARLDIDRVDTVIALDVIEHLTREDGVALIAEMQRIAQSQAIVFTPLGFMPQDGGEETDAWGYHGQHWQAHRSGWTPDDFPGWRCFVSEDFHHGAGRPFGAFFAIWNRA